MTQRIQRAAEHFVPCVWDEKAEEWIPVGEADVYKTETGAFKALLKSIADEWNTTICAVATRVMPGLPVMGEEAKRMRLPISKIGGAFWRLVGPGGWIAEIYAIRRAIVGE